MDGGGPPARYPSHAARRRALIWTSQPLEDDMTASAAVAAASNEALAAAVGGEPAGPQAAIVIVGRDSGAREILQREVSKRYGADYQIVVCSRPAELASWMRDLRAADLPVALVIGGGGAPEPGGIEGPAAVPAHHPP